MLINTNWERQYLTGLLHKMKSYFVKNTISNTVNLDIVQFTQLNLRKKLVLLFTSLFKILRIKYLSLTISFPKLQRKIHNFPQMTKIGIKKRVE